MASLMASRMAACQESHNLRFSGLVDPLGPSSWPPAVQLLSLGGVACPSDKCRILGPRAHRSAPHSSALQVLGSPPSVVAYTLRHGALQLELRRSVSECGGAGVGIVVESRGDWWRRRRSPEGASFGFEEQAGWLR